MTKGLVRTPWPWLLGLVCGLCCLLWPQSGWAAVDNCVRIPDGTPCASDCILTGFCRSGACIMQIPAPNGSPCASGNRCTMNDQCSAGQCIPGTPVVCPDLDQCQIGACDPATGCYLQNICMPPFSDGGASVQDAGSGGGGGGVDSGTGADGSSSSSDGSVPVAGDGGLVPGDAGGMAGDGGAVGEGDGGLPHVTGSALFGCSALPGSGSSSVLWACLLLLPALLGRRLAARR